MDDLISRSDAIGAVKEERFPIDSDYAEGFMAALDKVEWILKEWLPSAQPEPSQMARDIATIIENEKDMRVIAQPETHEERTETHSCDCISRQAAIDALNEQIELCNKALGSFDISLKDEYAIKVERASLEAYKEQLKNLPSAQPETAKRIVGKSRGGMTLWYQCNMCNEPVDAQDNFCRGCGRRLTDG